MHMISLTNSCLFFIYLTFSFLQALCSGGVIFSSLGFQFSKLKKLRCICSTISSKTRDSLACFLNITPSLEGLSLQVSTFVTTSRTLSYHGTLNL